LTLPFLARAQYGEIHRVTSASKIESTPFFFRPPHIRRHHLHGLRRKHSRSPEIPISYTGQGRNSNVGRDPITIEHSKSQVIQSDLFNLYAPDVYTYKGVKCMVSGGWLKSEDQGPDKIYYSEQRPDGTWTYPEVAFELPGFHVNDPTIIQHPEHDDWLFMYFTALPDEYATEKEMTLHNWVGFASSTTGGKTWDFRGIVIGQDNGFNGSGGAFRMTGAWAPSAIVVGNEIWVYYHTNQQSDGGKDYTVLRTRFDLNGWRKIGDTEEVKFFSRQEGGLLADNHLKINVDVFEQNGKYYMLANYDSLTNVAIFESKDGITFNQIDGADLLLVQGGNNMVVTPHGEPVNNEVFNLYFGFGPYLGNDADSEMPGFSHSIHKWEIHILNK